MGFMVFTAMRELCCGLVAYEPGGSLEGACRNITGMTHCLHFQDKELLLFYPENGSSMLPRNISNHTRPHDVITQKTTTCISIILCRFLIG
jgi:hypothetical protein